MTTTTTPRTNQTLNIVRTLAALAVSVVLSIAASMLVIVPLLNPPTQDIEQLLVFMSISGIITISVAYVLYRSRVTQWFATLRWTLVAMIALTVVLIFVNVWWIAQQMFIGDHDLILTTGLLIFAGIVSAASVFIISGTLINRIHALSKAAEQFAGGDFATRLPVHGNDELAQLAHTFNVMATAVHDMDEQKRKLDQARRDLIAWVSHDLRTPLAAMRAMNEALTDGVVSDPATVQAYYGNIQNEIAHLTRLIDDLFELTRLDSGHPELNIVETSIGDLISDTVGSTKARADRQGVSLIGEVDSTLDTVHLAPDKIQRVLFNLLDNALNFTPEGGTITLSARHRGQNVEICVHNTGSLIDSTDLPRVFESFYRAEKSRAQKDGHRGTGLGLAIARGFVQAHGGDITVESAKNYGTAFRFTLPLVQKRYQNPKISHT